MSHRKSGYHHRQRRIHIRNIVHSIQKRTGDPELDEEEDHCRECGDHHGGKDAVTEVAQIEVSLHLAETVGPGKQIKYGHIGGQIEDARVSQYASDQRDSDKATVGIDRSVTLQPEICRASFADQQG